MDARQTTRSLESMFIGVEFRFDERSRDLQRMKIMLLSGKSIELIPTDIPDGDGAGDRPEVVASFFVSHGRYREHLVQIHGDLVTETPGELVLQLGAPCPETERIMNALAAKCTTYLIPERKDGVAGRYTLCVIA